jgi:hypothetical protein
LIPATFNWVFLDDNNLFGVHMYKAEFKDVIKDGHIELGVSPIFGVPSHFKVKRDTGLVEKIELQKVYNYTFFLPFFIIFLAGLWLFSKPQKSLQWVMYGYICMATVPILSLVLILKIIDFVTGIGFYEIVISGLDIPS